MKSTPENYRTAAIAGLHAVMALSLLGLGLGLGLTILDWRLRTSGIPELSKGGQAFVAISLLLGLAVGAIALALRVALSSIIKGLAKNRWTAAPSRFQWPAYAIILAIGALIGIFLSLRYGSVDLGGL